MARTRRKVGGAGNYKKYKTYAEGDYVVGKFVRTGEDRTYGKPYYVIELEEFKFETPECCSPLGKEIVVGMELTLNSAGSLDHKMEEITIGSIVEIVYNGTEPLPADHKFKNKDAHQFDVFEIDDDEAETTGADDL